MSDDQVGYGKPPKHSQFVPGKSGNPRGRPRKEQRHLLPRQMRKDVLRLLEEEFPVQTGRGTEYISGMQIVLRATLQRAIAGNPTSLKLFLNLATVALKERMEAHPAVRIIDKFMEADDAEKLLLHEVMENPDLLHKTVKNLY